MASGATAGVKRSRTDVPVYCAHMASKRARPLAPLPVDVGALLRSDNASAARFEARARTLDALGMGAAHVSQMLRLLGDSTLALVDLNAHAHSVAAVLRDFAQRGVSVVDFNVRSHAYYCRGGDAFEVADAFIAANQGQTLACAVLKWVVTTLFAEEKSIGVRVLSGGGVRDVLLADWCRGYKFCTNTANPSVPNVLVVTAESGRAFLVPFAT